MLENLINKKLQKEWDSLNIGQIALRLTKPAQEEFPDISLEEIATFYSTLIERRVWAEGTEEREGELLKAAHYLSNSKHPLNQHYSQSISTRTQFHQVKEIIKLVGEDYFGIENLRKIYFNENTDKETQRKQELIIQTIRTNFLDVINANEKELEEKKKKGIPPQGFVEGIYDTNIEVDLLVRKDFSIHNPRSNLPAILAIKYGKTSKSLAEKLGFYIAEKLIDLESRQTTHHKLDAYAPLAYVLEKGTKAFEDNDFKAIFSPITNTNETNQKFKEELLLLKEKYDIWKGNKKSYMTTGLDKDKKTRVDIEKDYDANDKLKAMKDFNTQSKALKRKVKEHINNIGKEQQRDILQKIYENINIIRDFRGIKAIMGNGYFTRNHEGLLKKTDQYIEGTLETHDIPSKHYRASHSNWFSNILKKAAPERWQKLKEAARYEIHVLDVDGYILDLLGPDNNWKYHQAKTGSGKYSEFTRQQEKIADDIAKRVRVLTDPAEKSFKLMLPIARYRRYEDDDEILVEAIIRNSIETYKEIYGENQFNERYGNKKTTR